MINKMQPQSGRSMIEMLGVLAVIGVLTVGGFSLISKVTTSHKSNVAIDEIGALANRTRMVFREFVLDNKSSITSASSTAVPMNEYLCKARAYPESLEYPKDSNGKCESGKTFISTHDIKFNVQCFRNNDVDYFYIEVSQLDDEMCMAIAQSTWGSPSINGYVGICIGSSCTNGGVVGNTNPGANVAQGGAKLSLDGASSACVSGNTTTGNQVFLTYR